jgi:hypothetical protein
LYQFSGERICQTRFSQVRWEYRPEALMVVDTLPYAEGAFCEVGTTLRHRSAQGLGQDAPNPMEIQDLEPMRREM